MNRRCSGLLSFEAMRWPSRECRWGDGQYRGRDGTPLLVLLSPTTDGWVQLAAGPLIVSTFVTNVNIARLVFSVAGKK